MEPSGAQAAGAQQLRLCLDTALRGRRQVRDSCWCGLADGKAAPMARCTPELSSLPHCLIATPTQPVCAQEDGTLQQLHDSWIVSPDTGCQSFTQVGASLPLLP